MIENNNKLHLTILILAILFIVILRIHFIDFPLERDEGGFAYIANQILHGIPPYISGYDFKPPGLYLTYAIFIKLFGHTAAAIHTGLLLFNAATLILIFLFAKYLLGAIEGLIATLFYGLLSLSPGVLGFASHATHFVVFWMMLGSVFILLFHKNNKYIFLLSAGISFGLSSLMKQPGFVFILFGFILLFYPHQSDVVPTKSYPKKIFIFISGIIIPYLLVIFWFWKIDALDKFLFWSFEYGFYFSEVIQKNEIINQLITGIIKASRDFISIWLIALAGLVVIIFDKSGGRKKMIIKLFFIISFISISLGFHFRPHYFVMILPAISILSAYLISRLSKQMTKNISTNFKEYFPFIFTTLIIGFVIISNYSYFVKDSTDKICRRVYHPNPFADSKLVAEYIQTHTTKDDKIAILGSEPQILFYSDRLSASPFIFTYFLMEPQKYNLEMQKEMIRDIEMTSPKYLIFINHPISWIVFPNSELFIFRWANDYIKKYYSLVGLVDVISKEKSIIKWDDEARNYQNLNNAIIQIYRREIK
ncbi:MAG: glycosyltransferase family 39 protein [Ignavibacteriales bacterium]|nr:glycosyltransferase family 39 protein [Ignavibacteriales bacterium]